MKIITPQEVDRIVTEQAARMADSLALAHAEEMEDAERDRLQGCADRHLLESRESVMRINAIEFEVVEMDNEAIVDFGAEYGLELPELVARLRFFIEYAEGK